MDTLNEQYYMRSVSTSSPEATDEFIYNLVTIFDAMRTNGDFKDGLSKKNGISPLFEALLYDIDRRTNLISSKYREELDSVTKMKSFVQDVYEKLIGGEEIYGMTYQILTNKDFGYHIAYDMYNPKKGSFEPVRNNYPTDYLPFSHVVQEAGGLILVW